MHIRFKVRATVNVAAHTVIRALDGQEADIERSVLDAHDLREGEDYDVLAESAPKPAKAPAPKPAKAPAPKPEKATKPAKAPVDVAALESAAEKAAHGVEKLTAALAKASGAAAEAIKIKLSKAERARDEANAALAAAKGE